MGNEVIFVISPLASFYTVKVTKVCSGGEHIAVDFYRDGVKWRSTQTTRSDLLLARDDVNFSELLDTLLYLTIRASGASTLPQAKTAIESAQWEL